MRLKRCPAYPGSIVCQLSPAQTSNHARGFFLLKFSRSLSLLPHQHQADDSDHDEKHFARGDNRLRVHGKLLSGSCPGEAKHRE